MSQFTIRSNIDRKAAMKDPVHRNFQITQRYYELSQVIAKAYRDGVLEKGANMDKTVIAKLVWETADLLLPPFEPSDTPTTAGE